MDMDFKTDEINILEEIGVIFKSDTQSIRAILVEKDGERMLSLQKWWRDSGDGEWKIGKGFFLSEEETKSIKKFIERAETRFYDFDSKNRI